MSSSDCRCCWPGCHFPSEGTVEGKPLCDKHDALVLSEDPKVVDRSRAKIGLKPHAVIRGREATWDEFKVMCAVKSCGGGTTYWVEKKIPVCLWHTMGVADLEKLDLRAEVAYIKGSKTPDAPVAELLGELSPESAKAAASDDWESRLASGEFD